MPTKRPSGPARRGGHRAAVATYSPPESEAEEVDPSDLSSSPSEDEDDLEGQTLSDDSEVSEASWTDPEEEEDQETPSARATSAAEPGQLSELREHIFPTIYAAFQQCRGGHGGLCSDTVKVRNRTLRSLTRSCLYHRKIEQLERTRKDAEELLQRLCARRQAYRLDPDVTPL
ncbi:33K [Murine adenovirus 2]|uniref:33K n=1 Tax=Murine adenovirus 2 TaxID=931972 RepID=E7CH46_9ADEN|nr:33K [Murine adenovirus 2]ADR77847.1 33K [Murine adenovirus 2]